MFAHAHVPANMKSHTREMDSGAGMHGVLEGLLGTVWVEQIKANVRIEAHWAARVSRSLLENRELEGTRKGIFQRD